MTIQLSPRIQKDLKTIFQKFKAKKGNNFIIKLRRERAKQIEKLLSSSDITIEQFNKEIWVLESATYLSGTEFTNKIFKMINGSEDELIELENALDNGELELHGNYVWGSGTRIYGAGLEDKEAKKENVKRVISILNDTTLSPLEKAKEIEEVPYFGNNSATGLVMLYHPFEFAIYNNPSKTILRKLGQNVDTIEEFERNITKVKDFLEVEDFLELDWFLYLIDQSILKMTFEFWWVNQGDTAKQEGEGGYLWAPLKTKNGKRLHHHSNLRYAFPNDIVFHYLKGKIFAISQITSKALKSSRPGNFSSDAWQLDGRLVKTKYILLNNPIQLDTIEKQLRINESGPFNRKGGVNQGYFYQISESFVCIIAGLSKEVNDIMSSSLNVELEIEIKIVRGESTIPVPKFPILVEPVEFSLEYYETGFINSLKDILKKKKQIILYGPPGTGKTHLALGITQKLTEDKDDYEIIQFHPSFGYEDFVEGITVKTSDEGKAISYQTTPKIFREICQRAEELKSEDKHAVLVIDEINRGDLGRIFGELILGLEYRNMPIKTAYMRKPLIIPDNLLIIGTMNSVDRSIAIVDFALRRRFQFFPCMPSKSILNNYLSDRRLENALKSKILLLFDSLNNKILSEERNLGIHHQIGHVFFFVTTREEMERNWTFMIRPLLEEYLNFNTAAIGEFDGIFTTFKS